jgi:hypothetical protein
MTIEKGVVGSGLAACVVAGGFGVAAGCTGGGDTVISGIGNSGNRIGADSWAEVAEQFAAHAAIPPVTDAEIERMFGAIRAKALEGDLDSAMVVLKLAEQQREVE